MQAIQVSQFLSSPTFSSLTLSTLERPRPKADEYLIRITHVSLQHVDLLHAQGKHQNNNPKHGHVHPPFTLGLDFAGIVVSAPSAQAHDDLQSGDRVMGSKLGAFAEFICVKPSQIRKVPASISNEVAAALVGAAVSYGAVVHMAEVRKGETVLVTGANGGLGVVACQVAKALGAKVIGLVSSLDKARRLRSLLDIDVIVSGGAWETEVKAVGGGGVDVVIDNVGLVESSLQCLSFNGRIILVGFAGRKGIMEEVAMNKILLKGARIIGYRYGEQGRRDPHASERIWEGYLEMINSGAIVPVISPEIYKGIDSIPKALQQLADRRVSGKVIVQFCSHELAKL